MITFYSFRTFSCTSSTFTLVLCSLLLPLELLFIGVFSFLLNFLVHSPYFHPFGICRATVVSLCYFCVLFTVAVVATRVLNEKERVMIKTIDVPLDTYLLNTNIIERLFPHFFSHSVHACSVKQQRDKIRSFHNFLALRSHLRPCDVCTCEHINSTNQIQ